MKDETTRAEICPVCKGSGKYRKYYVTGLTADSYTETTCHGCNGIGWITISEIRKLGVNGGDCMEENPLLNLEPEDDNISVVKVNIMEAIDRGFRIVLTDNEFNSIDVTKQIVKKLKEAD